MEKEQQGRQTLDKSEERCPTQMGRKVRGGVVYVIRAQPTSGIWEWNLHFCVGENRFGPLKGLGGLSTVSNETKERFL